MIIKYLELRKVELVKFLIITKILINPKNHNQSVYYFAKCAKH